MEFKILNTQWFGLTLSKGPNWTSVFAGGREQATTRVT
jgi:hypothetical protein